MGETVKEALKWALEKLKEKGLEEPRLDAEVLLSHLLGMSRTKLYVNINAELTRSESEKFRLLIKRRGLREPVSYITGTKEFMSLDFKVSPRVLVPRPETELIVEEIFDLKPQVFVDVGTGSGAIAVSVAKNLSCVRGYAIDISKDALAVAVENGRIHRVNDRLEFLVGNLLEPLILRGIEPLDLIAANLPYIPEEFKEQLPEDVRLYEPEQALFAGRQGLDLYLSLLEQVPLVLKPGGVLLMEVGYNQGEILKDILASNPLFRSFKIIKDLAGKDRVVSVTLR